MTAEAASPPICISEIGEQLMSEVLLKAPSGLETSWVSIEI